MCNIPKIIHQTYKTHDIPDHWKLSPEMWRKHHPDWQYMFWTDADIREYIRKNYPDYLELHDNYKYPIQRADMIRYFILKDYGGIYSDLDLYPTENLEKYFETGSDSYFVFSPNQNSIINCFMASKKGAKIWDIVIPRLKNKPPSYAIGKHLYIYFTTGPYFLNKTILESDQHITLLPRNLFQAYDLNNQTDKGASNKIIKEAVLHQLEGQSWTGIDTKFYNFVYRNQLVLAFLFVAFVLIIISVMIYFIVKSKQIRNTCSKLGCFITSYNKI